MKYFRNAAGQVYAFEADGSQDAYIGADLLPITPAEADTLRGVLSPLERAVAAQLALLSAACSAQIMAGFQSSALGLPHTYPAKPLDQQNLTASVLASLMPGLLAGWTTPFWCADAAGVWAYTPHSAVQIQQVGQDGKAAVLAALTRNQTLAQQVAAATTVQAVQAVVW